MDKEKERYLQGQIICQQLQVIEKAEEKILQARDRLFELNYGELRPLDCALIKYSQLTKQ